MLDYEPPSDEPDPAPVAEVKTKDADIQPVPAYGPVVDIQPIPRFSACAAVWPGRPCSAL